MGECSHAGLSRREALTAIGGAAISAVAISDASNARSREGSKMTYVLIHPAWFGGWCWKKVTPLLRAQGHEVFTPTLTGLGERAHLARPEVGLEIHVRDIINVIEYENLRNVILVGNSSGGMVITGAADHVPERIAHLVFLDAFVPTDGQSMLDVIPPDRRPALEAFVQKEGDGWLLPRFAPPPWEKLVTETWQVTVMRELRARRRGGNHAKSRAHTCRTLRIQVSWRPCCCKWRPDHHSPTIGALTQIGASTRPMSVAGLNRVTMAVGFRSSPVSRRRLVQ